MDCPYCGRQVYYGFCFCDLGFEEIKEIEEDEAYLDEINDEAFICFQVKGLLRYIRDLEKRVSHLENISKKF